MNEIESVGQTTPPAPIAPMVRKSYKYKLKPTPEQVQALEEVVWRCRMLYNAGLEERKAAWDKRQVSVTRFQQEAQLKDIRAEHEEYAAIHSHVLQDVLARLDKAFQAFFRRVHAREKPGSPRFQGRDRYHSFTFKDYGNGARLDNGFLVLSKIGRIGLRWSRPLEGTPKTVTVFKEADGWYVIFSCAEVPMQLLPVSGKEAGIDVGIKAFYVDSNGNMSHNSQVLASRREETPPSAAQISPLPKGQQPSEESQTKCCEAASESEAATPGFPPQRSVAPAETLRYSVS